MSSQTQYMNNISSEIKQIGMDSDSNRTSRYQNLRQLLPVSSSPISIKCRCGHEVRRVTVHAAPTYDELSFLVHRLFRSSLSNNLGNLILKYIDEDYDLVSIIDDLDINHAIAISSSLKVVVFDRETIPIEKSIYRDFSSLSSSLSRPLIGMNSLDLRLELAQLINKVDLLLNNTGKDYVKPQNDSGNSKVNKKLSIADLDEFVKPSKLNNNSGLSESSPAIDIGTNELSTLKIETKPTSIYTSSLGQNSNQSNDMDFISSAPRPPVPGSNNYPSQSNTSLHNPMPQNNPPSQQNGYLPSAVVFPTPNSQQKVNQQPTHIYGYSSNGPNNQSSQYPPPNANQAYNQHPTSINSQAYTQSMYPPRPTGNSGSGYPNSSTAYSYQNSYPSAPGGPYQ